MLGREKEGADELKRDAAIIRHHHEEALRGAQAAALPGCATTACRSGPGLSSGHPLDNEKLLSSQSPKKALTPCAAPNAGLGPLWPWSILCLDKLL